MSENLKVKTYKRKITPIERVFLRSPYAIVTMVARIKGDLSEKMLRRAVSKVQLRHPNLRVRIIDDDDHNTWFTSESVKEIPVEVVTRESDDHWIQVFHEASQTPFEFDERPAIRFILVQSPNLSELIILCHHIICDGLSLAYLARDLMVHLGDPDREVDVLPDSLPVERDNLPEDISLNPIAGFFINRMNKKWAINKIFFDQEDYKNLNETYWNNFNHRMISVELTEAQTSAIVERCREEKVTVNSALTTAFVGAQTLVQGNKPYHSRIAVAGSMRDRLKRPVGEVMGFYAGAVTLKYAYNQKFSFWENARKLHQKLKPLYTNKNLFTDPLAWCYLEPGVLEALSFKMLGGLVPPDFSRYQKLSAFSKREDVVSASVKREKMDSFGQVNIGTAVTNLTRLDFPREYGELTLDRLMMNPGGAYPLVFVNLVLGAVTCAGKLSLVLEYAEETVDTKTMEIIRDKAMEFLLRLIK